MNTLALAPDGVRKLIAMVMASRRLSLSAAALLVASSYLAYSTFKRRYYAAPGPPRLPLLGNLLQIPSQLHFLKYTEWAQIYGPVFSLDVPGQHIVVVNTAEAAAELFERRSNVYNDRPRLIMANEILSGGVLLSAMQKNDSWRRMRRAVHESFNPRAVEQYQFIQLEAIVLGMLRTIANPDAWEKNLQVATASSIASSVYGWPPLEPESSMVQFIHDMVVRIGGAGLPGTYFVDLLPIMTYIPAMMARWKREGIAWHEEKTKSFDRFSENVAEQVARGDLQTNFISDIIMSEDRHRLTKKEFAWLPGVLILAGTDTTAIALVNCVLAMLHYPDVLRKAQGQLDEVIGRERAPTFEDEENLPYIQAIVHEVLRWRSPAPLAIPHMATEDSWYKGYFISKGTIVIGNIWAMNRDPSVYPDFETFRPERFLDASGKLRVALPNTHQMGHSSYGFGKRTCPGMYFAHQEMFIAIAMVLWGFNIRPFLDDQGNEVLPAKDEWVDATIVVHPASVKCEFSPRFSEVEDILKALIPTVL